MNRFNIRQKLSISGSKLTPIERLQFDPAPSMDMAVIKARVLALLNKESLSPKIDNKLYLSLYQR